ncbi:MAG: UDP-N-acetylmuramoyl-L-alanine--D-glutamate ligase [Saprospiraceae bacterium]|nr:UDP-N-acetylmuramoyl-L-alanine--D-glutamate ligase [Saprospiraceae bacterium]
MMAGKQIVILGGGESGVAAAILAQAKGYEVFVSDEGSIGAVFKAELLRAAIEFEEGGHFSPVLQDADLVIKSPGIPGENVLIQSYRDRDIQVISEIEFAARYISGQIIAITGTNGKTTTTHLLHHLFQHAGLSVGCGGNIGHAFARLAMDPPKDWYILELSSFQLDDIDQFHPHIALILNVTPDHLDRYQNSMDLYAGAKLNLSRNQGKEDYLILQKDNHYIDQVLANRPIRATMMWVGQPDGVSGKWLTVAEEKYDLTGFVLKGEHNLFNTTCSILAARKAGLSQRQIQEALSSFLPVSHRMEPIGELNGVRYINDSKATNVDAVWYALQAMDQPVIWIAGGKDKGNDYDALLPLAKEKVKALVCLGLDTRKLESVFAGVVPHISVCRSMQDAVSEAARLADEGDCVLLSPACASFDLFKNYEHRGNMFREAFHELLKETPTCH